jgi:hypothetical protein
VTALFTRPIQFEESWHRLQPGDQVDNSVDMAEDWCTVARLGQHAQDKGNEDAPDDFYCGGDCEGVIFFTDDDCAFAFHIRPGVEVFVRFPVEAGR